MWRKDEWAQMNTPNMNVLVGDSISTSDEAKQRQTSATLCSTWSRNAAAPLRANANLLRKIEASRLHALETLSSALFDNHNGRGRSTRSMAERNAVRTAKKEELNRPKRRSIERMSTAIQVRLRQRSDILVQEEREILLRELDAEMNLERKMFEERKPAILEEAYRKAKIEQVSALQKQERELRMVLARREFKGLKDATRERLSVAYAQEKEKTLARLRRSLNRGTGHSVSDLRGELWEEAHKKRTRTLHEGEAAFEHSCRLLRQQYDQNIQAKIDAMSGEAVIAEESALEALREAEAKTTVEELSSVARALARDRKEDETELRRQLHAEATTSVNIAVQACTSRHKLVQHETASKAAEAVRQTLDAAGEGEVALTKAVLEREVRRLDDQSSSLICAVEEALSACSLRKLAETEASRLPVFSPSPLAQRARRHNHGNRDKDNQRSPGYNKRDADVPSYAGGRMKEVDVDIERLVANSSLAKKALSAVRYAEGAAAAAEREYAKRARDLIRSRAVAALQERHDTRASVGLDVHDKGVGSVTAANFERNLAEEKCSESGSTGREGGCVVGCGGCAVLFEANERLLQEARARGFLT